MTTDKLDKFVAGSVAKGYDEALVLAGQMSSAIQDVANSSPATFSELVRFALCVSSRYERVIEKRVTVALPHDLKLLTTAVGFIASGRTFGDELNEAEYAVPCFSNYGHYCRAFVRCKYLQPFQISSLFFGFLEVPIGLFVHCLGPG